MSHDLFLINDFATPRIVHAEKNYVVVYKPPRIHSAPLLNSHGENITDWCVNKFPEIAVLPGKKRGDGGLLHRLDYETHGLLLIARTESFMEAIQEQQKDGKFIKEYTALSSAAEVNLLGFPRYDFFPLDSSKSKEMTIESRFRVYGQGRKSVRPVITETVKSGFTREKYTTKIIDSSNLSKRITILKIRLQRGFRHQIRCHLAWAGMPILNDSLYGGLSYGKGFLALRAVSLLFQDPVSGEKLCFSIPHLAPDTV